MIDLLWKAGSIVTFCRLKKWDCERLHDGPEICVGHPSFKNHFKAILTFWSMPPLPPRTGRTSWDAWVTQALRLVWGLGTVPRMVRPGKLSRETQYVPQALHIWSPSETFLCTLTHLAPRPLIPGLSLFMWLHGKSPSPYSTLRSPRRSQPKAIGWGRWVWLPFSPLSALTSK